MTGNNEQRPILNIEWTFADKLLEIGGWFVLLVPWIMIGIVYTSMPETIPTHYNFAGKPDAFGSKGTIFILPIVGTVLFIGLTILNKFSHVFNYPIKITHQNAVRQYTIATRLIRYLTFIVVLTFATILFVIFQASDEQAPGLGRWFLPTLIALIFVPLIYAIVKIYKAD